MRVYAAQIPRKYSRLVRRTKDEADETEQVYSTNEGDVLMSISGTGVFVERRVSTWRWRASCATAL